MAFEKDLKGMRVSLQTEGIASVKFLRRKFTIHVLDQQGREGKK